MRIEKVLRHLAQSSYWQRLYKASKDCYGIQLFENQSNLTGIQMMFLYWLEVYELLYKELAQKEWDILDEAVIQDDLRCDAFLYWRMKQNQKEYMKYKEDSKKMSKGTKAKGNQQQFAIYNGSRKGK